MPILVIHTASRKKSDVDSEAGRWGYYLTNVPNVSVTHGVGSDEVAKWSRCKSIVPKWVEASDQWPHAGDIGEALRKYNSSAVHDKKLRKVVEL